MEDLSDFWVKTFLFKDIDKDIVSKLLKLIEPEKKCFEKNQFIYTKEAYKRKVGFVVTGKCSIVRKSAEGANINLNTLNPTDSFGITAALSQDEFLTDVMAVKRTEVLFISEKDILFLVENNSKIALNLINFLTDRISFLNRKIATFSSANADKKLASFLLNEEKKYGSCFVINCKKTAESIGTARASFYRALNNLINSNLISFQNKKIYIIDPEGLKGMLK